MESQLSGFERDPMLKKTITYEDFNGQRRTEDFYFSFSKLEIMEMLEIDDLQTTIKGIEESESTARAYALFKKLILDAYGIKSEDGRTFIKNAQVRAEFEGSPALSELIFEFLENPKLGSQFIEGCVPPALVEQAKREMDADKVKKDTEDTPDVATVKDPTTMTHEELLEAYRQKTSS